MIDIGTLIDSPLPLVVEYAGTEKVKKSLRVLEIVERFPLNISFLDAAGDVGLRMSNGDCMWILDVAIKYNLKGAGKTSGADLTPRNRARTPSRA